MKSLLLVLAAGIGLGGCAIVPAYGPPVAYGPPRAYAPPGVYAVVPAPVIVVRPYYGYYGYSGYSGYRGYGRGSRHWH